MSLITRARPRYAFITHRPKTIQMLKHYDANYYLNNYAKSVEQKGFPLADLKLSKTQVRIIGVPEEESEEEVRQNLVDLQQLIMNEKMHRHYLIQIDSTPYLHLRRTLASKIVGKTASYQQDQIFNQLPFLPCNISELQLSLNMMDIAYLVKQNVKPTDEMLQGKEDGYFSKRLNEAAEGKLDGLNQEFSESLIDILTQSLLYQDSRQDVQVSLFQATYMSLLQDKMVSLVDMPELYLRVYNGLTLSLEEIQMCFKEYASQEIMMFKPNFELYNIGWRQLLKEYYILYTLNKYIHKFEPDYLTLMVKNVHYNQLREVIYRQKGQLMPEVTREYNLEFKFPQTQLQETDEQLIEKHALLDVLWEFEMWKQEFVRSNPFPYISKKYTDLPVNDQKELQKMFYLNSKKYNQVLETLRQKRASV